MATDWEGQDMEIKTGQLDRREARLDTEREVKAAQLRQIHRLLHIKADVCLRVARQLPEASLHRGDWTGLAAELRDVAWMIGELAEGRDVAALRGKARGCDGE